MEESWIEYDKGEIHLRDKWQFELKTDFVPKSGIESQNLTQEFYFFVPNALQINAETFPKNEFYIAQTNLIRLKTPIFELKDLLSPANLLSPYTKIKADADLPWEDLLEEYKWLANITRSSIRETVKDFSHEFVFKKDLQEVLEQLEDFCDEVKDLRYSFRQLAQRSLQRKDAKLFEVQLLLIDDFISLTLSDYLAELLEKIRELNNPIFSIVDYRICDQLIEEKKYREEKFGEPKEFPKGTLEQEKILSQRSVLNKYMLDALLLKVDRYSIDFRFRNWIGSMSAAFAMLVYLLLFIWQGNVFVINSQPYIILTVTIYVLKDRIKESVRALFLKQAFKWFLDYTTNIYSPMSSHVVGKVKEAFTFINDAEVSPTLKLIRQQGEYSAEIFGAREQILYYKKMVELESLIKIDEERESGLNIIFRFDIHRFLNKASDPEELVTFVNSQDRTLETKYLPKVYPINVILKTTTEGVETWKKYRVIVDKTGIKRVENLSDNVAYAK